MGRGLFGSSALILRSCALLATLLLSSAFSGDSRAAAPRADECDDHGWSGFVASLEKMHNGTRAMTGTRNADRDFIVLMLPHHRAAVEMARTELLCGKDPTVRRLAQEIIADQQSEIDLMNLWLSQHGSGSANDPQK